MRTTDCQENNSTYQVLTATSAEQPQDQSLFPTTLLEFHPLMALTKFLPSVASCCTPSSMTVLSATLSNSPTFRWARGGHSLRHHRFCSAVAVIISCLLTRLQGRAAAASLPPPTAAVVMLNQRETPPPPLPTIIITNNP